MSVHPKKADEQAALWAARLEGANLSEADREKLNEWLREEPNHRSMLSEYCQYSADLEQQLPLLVQSGLLVPPVRAEFLQTRRSRGKITAIIVGIAAMIALTFWFAAPFGRVEKIATTVGQRQSITLLDGTHVDLNAHTSLIIENGRGERRVRLAEGEAFFTVSKDKLRPFIVETPAGAVRVTGTIFDVRSENLHELQVTVVEGSVQVRPGELGATSASAPFSLVAGNKLCADEHGARVETLSTALLNEELAWRQGQVVFDHVPLSEALARFARYHGRSIVATPGAAILRVGGRFSLDDLDGFFGAIEEVLPVSVSKDLSGTVKVSLRTEK